MGKIIGYGFLIFAGFCAVGLGLKVVGGVFGWFGQAVTVAQEEFSPRAMLDKYEMFKDMSASLDAKLSSVTTLGTKINGMRQQYNGVAYKDWDRVDKENIALWLAERDGLVLSYKMLASDYNSSMAKFNYAFANVGQLPQGAQYPLPREYKMYETADQIVSLSDAKVLQ